MDSSELHVESGLEMRLELGLGVVGVGGAACAAQSTGLDFGCMGLVVVDDDGDADPKCVA